ncbi:MAG: GAF domain-containing sensor histidine kinase [Verrucomicrobiota bacterium]
MEDFSKDVATVSGIPAVLTILDVVCRTTGMGFAAVARVTDCRWVACSVLDHIRFGLVPGGELEVETTICHEIRSHQEPVVIDNVAEDLVYRDHRTPRQYGFQSYISVPIFLPGGQFFGTLCAIDPDPAMLKNPGIIGMFTLFAQLVAFHIDAAQKLASSAADLENERGDSLLREQFIAVLGHDLRSPLGAITMGVDLLKEGELEEHPAALVDMMGQSAHRMFGLIDDVMDFARGRLGGGIGLEREISTSVQPLLAHLIKEARTRWPERILEIHYDLSEPVDCDPKRLSQLVTNLLANAMTHGESGKPVSVTATSAGGRFDLSVVNASARIPPEKLARLFEPFSRGDADDGKQGLGLGLYIASQIARSHGGTLEVSSGNDEVTFSLSMPSVGAERGTRSE